MRIVHLSPTQDLLTLTTRGRRLRNLVTDHLARTFMTVVTTDDHPDLRLTLELNRRPPAEPEESPTRSGERLRNQESWGGTWTVSEAMRYEHPATTTGAP